MILQILQTSLDAILSQAFFILLFAAFVTVLVFPLVFVTSFLYDYLTGRYEKTPKVLIMLFVTFTASVTAIALIEVYLGYTLPQVIQALGS